MIWPVAASTSAALTEEEPMSKPSKYKGGVDLFCIICTNAQNFFSRQNDGRKADYMNSGQRKALFSQFLQYFAERRFEGRDQFVKGVYDKLNFI